MSLHVAAADVAAEKAAFVEAHRDRLVKKADDLVAKTAARQVELVDALERTREDLVEARETASFARTYPGGFAGSLPSPIALGLAEPTRAATGAATVLQPGSLFALLRTDAELLAGAPTPRGDDTTNRGRWEGTEEGQAELDAERKAALARLQNEWGTQLQNEWGG